MAFLYLMEWAIILLILLIIGTQVLVPIVRNRPLFPYFSKTKKAEDLLSEGRQKTDTASTLLEESEEELRRQEILNQIKQNRTRRKA